MSHERVDEAIDRVAKALTAVPADPGFSTRLSVRLERQPWNLTPWLLAVSSAVVVILVTLVMFRPTTGGTELSAGKNREPAPSRDGRRPDGWGDGPALFASAAPAPRTPVSPVAPAAPGPPVTPATPDTADSPAALHVEILIVEPLTIADVSVSPLEIASLEIEDIDGSGEPKEPK